MTTYIGTKVITAKPMTRLEYNQYRGWLASQTDMLSNDWVAEWLQVPNKNMQR